MKRASAAAATLFLLAAIPLAGAARGELDPGFGAGGTTTTEVGSRASAYALAVQPDGKLVVSGAAGEDEAAERLLVARYLQDGTLDRSFADGGILIRRESVGTHVAIQRDGGIVVLAGEAVHRYLPDGTPDAGFGEEGMVALPVAPGSSRSLVIQPDDRFVVVANASTVAGAREIRLLGFRRNGTPDTDFGMRGIVRTPADWVVLAAAPSPDGGIVLVGSWVHPAKQSSADALPVELVAARYGRAGTLDAGFGRGGVARHRLDPSDAVTPAVAVQRDGSVLAGGRGIAAGAPGRCCAVVWRLRPNGSLDRTFGDGGKAVTARARDERGTSRVYGVYGMAIDRGGRIVVTSHDVLDVGSRFGLARFTPTGRPDPRFGVDGAVTTIVGESARAWAVALQRDGRIVVAGTTGAGWVLGSTGRRGVALARYLVPPCVVPQLRTRTRAGAAVALRNAGCTLGRVTTGYSSSVARGRVISQGHRPLAALPEDTPVALVVSRGPRR